MSADPSSVEGLRRRLERERRIRHETERIAEQATRELYERQRAVALLAEVTSAANAGTSLTRTLERAVELICGFLGWPVGHAWLREGDALVPEAVWLLRDERFAGFREATDRLRLRPGEGLPGRVVERGAPVWIEDFAGNAPLPRRQAAADAGLLTAVGLPLSVGDRVEGILEFFCDRRLAPDEGVLELLAQAGTQLGRAIERDQAARELAAMHGRLEHEAAELERSNAELERFAVVASHDLRAPLATVGGILRLLERRELDLPPESRELLAAASDTVARMEQLLRRLLELARVGTAAFARAPVPLDAVVAQVRQDLAADCERLGAVIEHGRLPVVEGDAEQLYRLVLNLLGNAVKYHRPEAPPRVSVAAEPADGRWAVTVRDNGVGVPEDARAIFEPFSRGSGEHVADSMGIGLAICRAIVERHGGTIEARRRSDGPGTELRFTLPAVDG